MPVSNRYILHQGPVVGALARTAFKAAQQQRQGVSGAPVTTPGPELHAVLPPRPPDLVRDYIRWVGGDPASYRGVLPAHLFPQWVFPLQARGLEGLPYPLQKVLNGGCAVELHGPIPANEELDVRIRLESIDDNGERAIIHQKSITGTREHPDALVAHNYVIVPLGGKQGGGNGGATPKPKKERPRVPLDAREILFRKLGPKSGLDFAKLTGDFNPIHWIPPAAKASGFRNVILHGFATMAIAMEAVIRGIYSGDVSAVSRFDVRFTRPLVLPAKVGVFVDGHEVFVGDAPGGPAYLVGSYNLDRSEP